MGLGHVDDLSLAEARDAAADARRLVRAGVNPIEARRAARAESPSARTFADAADAYFVAKSPDWGNDKYREMTRLALTREAAPLRGLPVQGVDTEAVLAILKPRWLRTPKTARRIREKIEAVLDYATVTGWRHGDNPARWRGHLEHLLPRHDASLEGHHAAMPYADAPAFYARLRQTEGVTARALEWTILTAARSGETRGATWGEIDLDGRVWSIPPERMKMKSGHRVPLCDRALEIVLEMQTWRVSDFVFPGRNRNAGLSHVAMARALERMGAEGVTVHGWRSTFRDWTGDCTQYPREIAEAALAHTIGNKAEQAYRRGDALEKRRALMNDWAVYLAGQSS